MATSLGDVVVTVGADTKGLKGDISKGTNEAFDGAKGPIKKKGTSLGKKFAKKLGGAAKKAAKYSMVGVGVTAGAAVVAGFKSGIDAQKSEATLSGLYDSADTAKKIMKDLRKVSKNSSIDYSAYTKTAETLAYMGVTGKDVGPMLDKMGKMITGAGGSSADLERAGDSMLKMVNSGKVYAADLNQLSATGIPVISGLATKMFGDSSAASIAKMREAVSAGKVSVDDVQSVIQNATGKNAKAQIRSAKEVEKTFSATWKRTKDNVVVSIGAMVGPLITKLTPALEKAGNFITGFVEQLQTGKGAGGAFVSVIKTMGDVLTTSYDILATGIGFISEHKKAFGIIAGIITTVFIPALIQMGVQSLLSGAKTAGGWVLAQLAAIKSTAIQLAKFALQGVQWVALGIKALAQGAVVVAGWALTGAGAVAATTIALAQFALQGAKWVWMGVQATAAALKIAAAWIISMGPIAIVIAVVIAAIVLIIKYWDKLGPAFSAVWEWIKTNIFTPIGNFFTTTIPGWVSSGVGLIKTAWTKVQSIIMVPWTWVKTNILIPLGDFFILTIPGWIISGVGKVKTAWTKVQEIIKAPFTWIKTNVFDPLMGFIKTTIPKAFDKGVSAIGTAWDKLQQAAKTPVKFVVDHVINPLIGGINKILPSKWELPSIKMKGWSDGGYTGHLPTGRVAGAVHGDEHVIRSKSRRKFERKHPGQLDYLNQHGALPGYAGGGHVWPVPGQRNQHTSGYPWARWAGDMPVPMGTPVRSYADGVVSAVRHLTTSYGKHIRINHGSMNTLYAHLSQTLASVGQQVSAGQVIGKSGSTGNSTGPHLHFEIAGGSGPIGAGSQSGGGPTLLQKITSFFTEKMPAFIAKAGNPANGGMFGGGFGGVIKDMGSGMLEKLKGIPGEILNAAWSGVKKVGSVAKKILSLGTLGGFDTGGLARGSGFLHKPTIQPERMLSPRQTSAFEDLIPLLQKGFTDSEQQKPNKELVQLLEETRRQNDLLAEQNRIFGKWPDEQLRILRMGGGL